MEELVIKNLDGNDLNISVFDIIKDTENNNEYLCYTLENDENAYVSRLIESDNSFSLENVTEEEKSIIDEIINRNFAEGKYEQ